MTILCAAHLEPMYVTRASEWSMDLYACTEVICTSETGTVRLCKGRHVSDVSEGLWCVILHMVAMCLSSNFRAHMS